MPYDRNDQSRRAVETRGSSNNSVPRRLDVHDEQSSVVRNPAPDASPPATPTNSRTFTVSS